MDGPTFKYRGGKISIFLIPGKACTRPWFTAMPVGTATALSVVSIDTLELGTLLALKGYFTLFLEIACL